MSSLLDAAFSALQVRAAEEQRLGCKLSTQAYEKVKNTEVCAR